MRLIAQIAAVVVVSPLLCCHAEKIQWAKGAHHFGHECMPPQTTCTLADVPSPDGKYTAHVSLINNSTAVEIIAGSAHTRLDWSFDPEDPFVQMEILWSPDSSAVSFAWNNTAITNNSRIYRVTANGPSQLDLRPIMLNMAGTYTPCAGYSTDCGFHKTGEDYNYLTVAWSAPHTAVLMAEVPCSSRAGRNMCQVAGYEVDAITGSTTRTMSASELKRRWQSRMAWQLRIPKAP